jgi:hypothetical protein
MKLVAVVGCMGRARASAVLAASLLLVAAGVAGCGGGTSTADVRNCLSAPVVSFQQARGAPRTYKSLEVTVSCNPPHPFEVSEVSEGVDYPVLMIQHGGEDTCVGRLFRAKGEDCAVQVAFEPSSNNNVGGYETSVFFQYAHENETFIASLVGRIT